MVEFPAGEESTDDLREGVEEAREASSKESRGGGAEGLSFA